MLRKPSVADQRVYFMEKVAHSGYYARDSVQVKARYNVSADKNGSCYALGMSPGWFERLRQVIESDDRSHNKLSEDAGLGRNYVQQMLKDGKQPGSDRLTKLLAVLGDEESVYIVTGLRASREDIEFLRLVSALSPGSREDAKRLLQRLVVQEGAAEQSPDEPGATDARD